ncbi:hypothetical protein [Fodinicurvata sp. EGI_FJ10296]|uniref:hypothetical protein n=1 Tax=Fodinicurvata sp. EGI_FJ10296 TaxID=3231908 RepID=UPI003453976D
MKRVGFMPSDLRGQVGNGEPDGPTVTTIPINRHVVLHYNKGTVVYRSTFIRTAKATIFATNVEIDRVVIHLVSFDREASKAQGPVRTYLADRVIEAIDAETGEILNLKRVLVAAGLPERVVSIGLDRKVSRLRTVEHGLSFCGPNGGLPGWHFHVDAAFKGALDLVGSVNSVRARLNPDHMYSQGVPPAYAFGRGDILYDHPGAKLTSWSNTLRSAKRLIEVADARPDIPTIQGTVTPGEVQFREFRIRNENLEMVRVNRTTQCGFVDLLKYGESSD